MPSKAEYLAAKLLCKLLDDTQGLNEVMLAVREEQMFTTFIRTVIQYAGETHDMMAREWFVALRIIKEYESAIHPRTGLPESPQP